MFKKTQQLKNKTVNSNCYQMFTSENTRNLLIDWLGRTPDISATNFLELEQKSGSFAINFFRILLKRV